MKGIQKNSIVSLLKTKFFFLFNPFYLIYLYTVSSCQIVFKKQIISKIVKQEYKKIEIINGQLNQVSYGIKITLLVLQQLPDISHCNKILLPVKKLH